MTIKAFAPSGYLAGKLMEMISESDDARLARNETRISQGLASFVEVGEALSDIRDARLYRATHGTFESYCAEKWGMTKGRVYQLIGATEVMSTIVDKGAIATESQARELARVEPARREEVIRKADIATGGKITAAAIKEAAVVVVEPVARERPRDRFEMPPRALFSMWCAQQENGGCIVGARAWKDRQWQQTCGVSRREVDNALKLLTWEGEDMIVWNYPKDKQAEVQAKREAGRLGGLATTEAKTKAVRENGALGGRPTTQAETKAVLEKEPKQNLSTNLTEGKGREEEGKGKESIHSSAPPPPPPPEEAIYLAYPRRQGRADALKAIAKALAAGQSAERLLERSAAFAAATALWPESDRAFIPHPATWFNRGSYDDDPATWVRHGPTNNRVGNMTAQDHANGF